MGGGFLPEGDLVADDFWQAFALARRLGGGGVWRLGDGGGSRGDWGDEKGVVVEKALLALLLQEEANLAAEPAGGGVGVIAQAGQGYGLAIGVQGGVSQDLGVADGKLAAAHQVLQVWPEAQELDAELDADAGDAGALGAGFYRPAVAGDAVCVGVGFVYRVEVGAGDVFCEHEGGGLFVVNVEDDSRDFGQARQFAGPPAALAGNNLVLRFPGFERFSAIAGFIWLVICGGYDATTMLAVVNRSDGDGLDEAVLFDAGGKFLELGRVESCAVVVSGHNFV